MPCNNCQKIIDKFEKGCQEGGEDAVKSLINCKECSNEITNICHTCRWPIYEKELVYESSLDSSLKESDWIFFIKRIFRIENPEKILQCDWCFQQWETELEEREKSLKWREWIIGPFSLLALVSAFTLFYPEWIKRILDECKCFKKCSHPYFSIALWSFSIFIVSALVIMLIAWKIPKAKRYKGRKYRNKQSKEIKKPLKKTKSLNNFPIFQ